MDGKRDLVYGLSVTCLSTLGLGADTGWVSYICTFGFVGYDGDWVLHGVLVALVIRPTYLVSRYYLLMHLMGYAWYIV